MHGSMSITSASATLVGLLADPDPALSPCASDGSDNICDFFYEILRASS